LQAGYFSQKQAETSPLTSPVASGNPTDATVFEKNLALIKVMEMDIFLFN
jgi:hypothetical protein